MLVTSLKNATVRFHATLIMGEFWNVAKLITWEPRFTAKLLFLDEILSLEMHIMSRDSNYAKYIGCWGLLFHVM